MTPAGSGSQTPVRGLTERELTWATLERQLLLRRATLTPAAAIDRLVGLQAQYSPSPYIALRARLDDFRVADLEAALADRSVVRATVHRGTLHLVTATDVGLLTRATSEARLANWAPTVRRAGIDDADLHRRLLAYAGTPRTVRELEAHIDEVAPDADLARHAPGGVRHVGFRVAMARGWLVTVPPAGGWREFGTARYLDAHAWIPGALASLPPPAEARAILLRRYLAAYGPASLDDATKWLGERSIVRMRAAEAALGEALVRYRGPDGRTLLDLAALTLPTGDEPAPPRFLARWDSVVIGYDRRERILPSAIEAAVIRKANGDFLPSFTAGGRVAGTWSLVREDGDRVAIVELVALTGIEPADRAALEEEGRDLARFAAADAADHGVRWVSG